MAICASCANRGAVVVRYRSGEPFDVVICSCQAGLFWETQGEPAIREHFQLDATHQVGYREDLDADAPAQPGGFLQAGQTAKHAKL